MVSGDWQLLRPSGQTRSEKLKLSQGVVAKHLHPSQSRVAKMEAGEASVSLDLLVRALVTLGATTNDLAKAIQSKKKRVAAYRRVLHRL